MYVRRMSFALLAGLLGATLVGQADSALAQGKPKVFHYARANVEKSLDPQAQLDGASGDIVQNVYDPLLQYHYLKRPYDIEPNLLAKMPETAADKVTITFELRKGVFFIDDECFAGGKGRELKADDVIYSIKRYADANINNQSWFMLDGAIEGMNEFREQTKKSKTPDYSKLQISGIKKVDDYKLTVKLTKPNPVALYAFASTPLSIVPREAVEKYGKEFARHPVGTGPFILRSVPRRGELVLKKNPKYHMTYPSEGAPGDKEKGLLADAGKQLPLVDEVRLPLIEEAQPTMLKYLKGEIDWTGMDRDNFVRMAGKKPNGEFYLKDEYAKKFNMYTEPFLSVEYIIINMKDPILGKNKALRQALAYALNSGRFIDEMRNGRGWPVQSIVPIPLNGGEKETGAKWYAQDIEMAKKKLAEAGFPGGKGAPEMQLDFRASTTDTRKDGEWFRAEFAKAGLIVKPGFHEFSAYLKRMDEGNFQLGSSGWGADYPDAENFYQLMYSANKAPGPNAGSWANAEYDKLYEETRYMANGPERLAKFKRMNEILKEEVPILITWNPMAFGIYQKWVSNLKRNMMADLPLKYYNVDADLKAKGLMGH